MPPSLPELTSIVAVPSAASVNGGLYPSTTSGNGLLVGYACPSPLGRADKHKACWCVSMPPLARMRPVLCLLTRSSRAMAVMAFATLITVRWPARTRLVRRETYVHGVVVSGAAERGQAPQERDGLLPRCGGQADVVAGKLGHNGETPGMAVSVAGDSHHAIEAGRVHTSKSRSSPHRLPRGPKHAARHRWTL